MPATPTPTMPAAKSPPTSRLKVSAKLKAKNIRLFTHQNLRAQETIHLTPPQHHYLRHVMRCAPQDSIHLFNNHHGEWCGTLTSLTKRQASVQIDKLVRKAEKPADIWLLFAPLKGGKTAFVAQKATELGSAALWPVITQRCDVGKVNMPRLQSHCIEAAEQCGLVALPELFAPVCLKDLLKQWPTHHAGRTLLFCDENHPTTRRKPSSHHGVESIFTDILAHTTKPASWAVLIGPEGGFDSEERAQIMALPQSYPLPLGPRILRADTAAVSALTLCQAFLGDWQACFKPPTS